MPFSAGVSASRPPLKVATIETSGSRSSSRTRRRRPFESVNFSTTPAREDEVPAVRFRAVPCGTSVETVRFSEVRCARETRMSSSEVTRWIAAR